MRTYDHAPSVICSDDGNAMCKDRSASSFEIRELTEMKSV